MPTGLRGNLYQYLVLNPDSTFRKNWIRIQKSVYFILYKVQEKNSELQDIKPSSPHRNMTKKPPGRSRVNTIPFSTFILSSSRIAGLNCEADSNQSQTISTGFSSIRGILRRVVEYVEGHFTEGW